MMKGKLEYTLEKKAKLLGATEFGGSWRKGKKFYVKYKGRYIHFGAEGYSDYTKHKDTNRRKNYRLRHSQIKLSDGSLAYKNPAQPAYWSWHILW